MDSKSSQRGDDWGAPRNWERNRPQDLRAPNSSPFLQFLASLIFALWSLDFAPRCWGCERRQDLCKTTTGGTLIGQQSNLLGPATEGGSIHGHRRIKWVKSRFGNKSVFARSVSSRFLSRN